MNVRFYSYFLYSSSIMCSYFSQNLTSLIYIEKNYDLKTNRNVWVSWDPFHELTSQECVLLDSEVQPSVTARSLAFIYTFMTYKVRFKLGTNFIYDV